MENVCKNSGAQIKLPVKFYGECGTLINSNLVFPPELSITTPKAIMQPKDSSLSIIILVLVLVAVMTMVAFLKLKPFESKGTSVRIKEFTSQPYGNRAIIIHGTGFGSFDLETSRAMIAATDRIDDRIQGEWVNMKDEPTEPFGILSANKNPFMVHWKLADAKNDLSIVALAEKAERYSSTPNFIYEWQAKK